MKKISVIIPTHKTNKLFYTCIDSVINQTLSSDEYNIIIILNGIKEPYYSEIQGFLEERKVKNYTLLFEKWASISNARNIGLENAHTSYITFIDDDDFISKDFLRQTLSKATKNTLVVSNVWSFYHSPEPRLNHYLSRCFTNNFYRKKTLLRMRHYFSVCHASLIPQNVIKNKRFNTLFQNGEDCLFMASISNNIKHIEMTDISTFYYKRLRMHSLSNEFINLPSIIMNAVKARIHFIRMYFSDRNYNFLFFITRILGVIKGIVARLIRKRKLINNL